MRVFICVCVCICLQEKENIASTSSCLLPVFLIWSFYFFFLILCHGSWNSMPWDWQYQHTKSAFPHQSRLSVKFLVYFFHFFFFYLELLHPRGNHRPSPCPKDDCFCDPAMLLQLIFPPKPFTTDISSYISVSLYACFLAMLLFEFLAHPMMCFLYMIIYCLVPSELVNMVFLIPLPHMWHVQASPAF